MIGPCFYCDSLAPPTFGLIFSLGPCVENNICSSGLAFSPLWSSRPPPRAVVHLIPRLWAPGVGASSVPATPSLTSKQGQGFLFCFVLFPFQVPPSPSSCHFERKSSALGLNKTNKLTKTKESKSGSKIKTLQN